MERKFFIGADAEIFRERVTVVVFQRVFMVLEHSIQIQFIGTEQFPERAVNHYFSIAVFHNMDFNSLGRHRDDMDIIEIQIQLLVAFHLIIGQFFIQSVF